MHLTWLGTAGFILDTGKRTVLVDPFLTRNPEARPKIGMRPRDVKEADCIFVTHGHFDHSQDVRAIAERTGARVYCPPPLAKRLVKRGLKKKSVQAVRHAKRFAFDDFTAVPYESRHVRFDLRLVATSLLRMAPSVPGLLPLLKYPKGQVFSYKFLVDGKVVHHFGSAGSTRTELANLSRLDRTDILLLPLQGNSKINEIGLEYVRLLRPAVVIPQHFDDFYPPISRKVDISGFESGLKKACPDTALVKLRPLKKRTF